MNIGFSPYCPVSLAAAGVADRCPRRRRSDENQDRRAKDHVGKEVLVEFKVESAYFKDDNQTVLSEFQGQ